MRFFKKKQKLDIKIYGDPVLRKQAERIEKIDDSIISLASAMIKTMEEADGVGLAAPQIGESIRLIILGVPYDKEKMGHRSPGEMQLLPQMPLVLINPELTPATHDMSSSEEGCLSVPKIYAKVVRPERVMLSAEMIDGRKINVECGGFLARALQHECDHLNGILFPDIIEESELKQITPLLEKLKKKR
jgi:peptide deformylase